VLDGRKPELTGGGLLRSSGGWGVLKVMRRMKQHVKGDERILGDFDMVESVLNQAQENLECSYRLQTEGFTIEKIYACVTDIFELPTESNVAQSKEPLNARAGSVAAYWAVKQVPCR